MRDDGKKITSNFDWEQKFEKKLRPMCVVVQEENRTCVLSWKRNSSARGRLNEIFGSLSLQAF